ncbi:mitochondrial Rho GTPase isoform X2 [Cimex lectularius]|uniref:Mitochondrial Rho GTPase n=1 Tax=Cimex lectularius TaxID=79782 RepID=A0A8I6SMP8_CIMLE|nr:mitochondrial Rho GTPase isoform X2 [Cimex lectularius]
MVVKSGLVKNVRILLLGDSGVGKTSLILSLVSEEFPEDVPAKAEEITIPPDVTPEMVPTHIVDYSSHEQSEDQLFDEVKRADVICLVYAVNDDQTLLRITTYWLPLLFFVIPYNKCPIILVGNKVDLIEDTTVSAAQDLMEEYSEIESFVECSAKTLKNISEMFYYAQKAVLHPTGPIYVTEKQDLTENCKKALTRIFMVCDLDNDGLLNDYELNAFQKRCFDMPLRPEAMEDVKDVLKRCINGGVSPNNCITLIGFLYLHCLFMQRGRSHTTWTVLRKFGYNNQLHLSKDFLFPPLKVPHGSSTELNYKGAQFFTKLFWRFDKDRDGALSDVELSQLFATCPSPAWGADISNIVPCNDKGWITLQGFLCFWMLTTVTDVKTTFEYLAYFGFPINECENQLSAIQVTREKKLDLLKKQSTRNVYVCHVIGMKGVGKSTLSRRLLDHSIERISEDVEGVPQRTINVVHVYGQEKYLIMKDIEVRNVSDPLGPTDVQCDVACLVYDATNPKSFEYVARIYLKYFEDGKIPVLVVCSKSDLQEVKQDYLVQPSAFCDAHRLAPPHKYSALSENGKEVFQKLATMAVFPHLTELSILSGDSILMKAGIGIAIVATIGLVVSRLMKNER